MKIQNFANKAREKMYVKRWLIYLFLLPSMCFSQVLNGSFEINDQPSLDDWISSCNEAESFNDAPAGAGQWCLGFLTGNLQGCFPRTAEQVIAGLNNGDIVEITAWARQDEQKPSYTSIYLRVTHGESTTLLAMDSTSSPQWTLLSATDTLVLEEGDSVAIVLDSGTTSGPDLIGRNSYFDLVEVKKNGLVIVSLNDKTEVSPANFNLSQNFPNPFNPATVINYRLVKDSPVDLSIFTMRGEKIATLVSEKQQPGNYSVRWDAAAFASGVYLYKLQTGDQREIKKMILIR